MKKIFALALCIALAAALWACGEDAPPPEEESPPDIFAGLAAPVRGPEDGQEYEQGQEEEYEEEYGPEYEPEVHRIRLGMFTIETPAGYEPITNPDGIILIPGLAAVIANYELLFGIEYGATVDRDINAPFRLYVDAPLVRMPDVGGRGILIEPEGTIIIILEGYEEIEIGRPAPWRIIIDRDTRHPVFEFHMNGVRIRALDSQFPVVRNEYDGVVLFKRSLIELPDGTTIEGPLNTLARVIPGGYFEITIGLGDARMTGPDGAVSVIPGGTVLDNEFIARHGGGIHEPEPELEEEAYGEDYGGYEDNEED